MADLREKILNKDDLDTRKVEVPEWDTDVYVRTLTAKEQDDFTNDTVKTSQRNGEVVQEQDLANFRARLVEKCAVDEDGDRIFKDGDAEWIGQKSTQAVERVADAAMDLNGMKEESVKATAKNSESAPNDGSPSG